MLGMHRAGTSAVTNVLVDLGFELPGEPVPASGDNPRGYWESREIVEIHDHFLHAVGRSWSDPRPLAAELFRGEAAATARARLREALARLALPRPRWVLKDPRMCRLMPLWEEMLTAGIVEAHVLHVVRSPLSVAGSLRDRDGFSTQKSFLLWLRHCLEAEAATRGRDRTWLHFEKLTASSLAGSAPRFRAVTGSPQLSLKRLGAAVDSIFDRSLVHHEHEIDASSDGLGAYPWILRAYQALHLLGTEREGEGRAQLDQLQTEIANADALLLGDPLTWEAENHGERYFRLYQEIERYHRSVEAQRQEIAAQRTEVDAMRQAFDAERRQLAAMHQEIALHERSAESWRDELARRQAAAESQRQGIVESLGALGEQGQRLAALSQNIDELARGQLAAESQRQGIADSLAALAEHRQQLAELAQAIAGERDTLGWIADRTSAIEKRISEKLEKRHLALLHKSLEVTARIEADWMSARDQLERANQEREAALRAADEARAELERVRRSLDGAQTEIDQLIHRASWKLTAPLRWLYGVLRGTRRARENHRS